MSEKKKDEQEQTPKKKLKISKEIIEELKDEDLDKVAGGGGEAPPALTPGFV